MMEVVVVLQHLQGFCAVPALAWLERKFGGRCDQPWWLQQATTFAGASEEDLLFEWHL